VIYSVILRSHSRSCTDRSSSLPIDSVGVGTVSSFPHSVPTITVVAVRSSADSVSATLNHTSHTQSHVSHSITRATLNPTCHTQSYVPTLNNAVSLCVSRAHALHRPSHTSQTKARVWLAVLVTDLFVSSLPTVVAQCRPHPRSRCSLPCISGLTSLTFNDLRSYYFHRSNECDVVGDRQIDD